jgi:hypothetical protein
MQNIFVGVAANPPFFVEGSRWSRRKFGVAVALGEVVPWTDLNTKYSC